MARVPTKFAPEVRAQAPAQSFERVAIRPARPTMDAAIGERYQGMANLGQAIGNIGGLFTALAEREDRNERFDVTLDFIRLEQENDQFQLESARQAPPGAPNYAADFVGTIEQRYDSFLAGIENEELRQEMALRAANSRQGRAEQAFTFELEQNDLFITSNLEQLYNDASTSTFQDPNSLELNLQRLDTALDAAGLSAQDTENFRAQTRQGLQEFAYRGLVESDPNATFTLGVDPRTGTVGGIVTDVQGNLNPENFVNLEPRVQAATRQLSALFGQPLAVTPNGGASARASGGSQHPHGRATDLLIAEYSEAERERLVALAVANGATGLGAYGPGSQGFNTLHVDYRTTGGNHFRDQIDGGIALWWRPASGDDRSWNDSTAPAWFTRGVERGVAMRQQGVVPEAAEGFAPLDFTAQALFEQGQVPRSFLDFIATAEGTGANYNAYFGNANNETVMLTQMTLNEVMAWQGTLGGPSTAAGRYQFLQSTLRGLKNVMNLTGDEIFSPELQDQLAVYLVQEDYRGGSDLETFATRLAQTWASLPDPATGESYYVRDGLNNARVSVADVYAALGTSGPALGDPRFRDIPLDRRLELARSAQARSEEIVAGQQAQQSAEYAGRLNAAQVGAFDGTFSYADLAGARREGWLTDYEDINRINGIIERRQNGTLAVQTFAAGLGTGSGYVYTQSDVGAANTLFERGGGAAALMAQDSDFVNAALLPIYNRTGIVPSSAVQALTTMSTYPDQRMQSFALQTIDRIANTPNVNPIQTFSEDTLTRAAAWRRQTQFIGEEAYFDLQRRLRDPANATALAQLRSQARESLTEVELGDILGEIPDGRLGAPVAPLLNHGTELRQDYETAYELAVLSMGTLDTQGAHEIAMQGVNRLWGVYNGGLMKYPPDRIYPQSNAGNHDWMMEQLRSEIQTDGELLLLSDPETRREVESGQSPAYRVMERLTDGQLVQVTDEAGNYLRFFFELPEELSGRSRLDTEGPTLNRAQRLEAIRAQREAERDAAPPITAAPNQFFGEEWQQQRDEMMTDALPQGGILQRLVAPISPNADTRIRR